MVHAIYDSPYGGDPRNGEMVEIVQENVWTGDSDSDPTFRFHTWIRFSDGEEAYVWPDEVQRG